MTKSEMVASIREGLDEMVSLTGVTDPEWAKINAIRFMENHRVMRALEDNLDDVESAS